jgi:curved DNA-binding protein CbpA
VLSNLWCLWPSVRARATPEILVMKTLYDVLDVRPNEDAGRVRKAFREAVKVSHPDLNVDDPEAPERFREMVRAKTILSDPELRALYDRMLDSERRATRPASPLASLDAKHVIVIAVVLAGAFTLFTYVAEIPFSKVKLVEGGTQGPINAADVQPATAASARDNEDAKVPSPAAPTTSNVADVDAALGIAPLAATNARFYREQGIAAYRQGNVSLAVADFSLSIRLDPNFKHAYVDRSLAFYRMNKANGAFADIVQAPKPLPNYFNRALPSGRR